MLFFLESVVGLVVCRIRAAEVYPCSMVLARVIFYTALIKANDHMGCCEKYVLHGNYCKTRQLIMRTGVF